MPWVKTEKKKKKMMFCSRLAKTSTQYRESHSGVVMAVTGGGVQALALSSTNNACATGLLWSVNVITHTKCAVWYPVQFESSARVSGDC